MEPLIQPKQEGLNPQNQQAFNRLLDWLDPDHEKAGQVYEKIRLWLIRFFEFNDCPFSEDCTDEVIQRVTRKLNEGVKVQADNPLTYFRGVARYVLLEYWKLKQRGPVTLDDLPPSAQPFVNPIENELQQTMQAERERALACLPKCLAELPDEGRQLFLRYHQKSSGDNIEFRAQLARELGLEINALRSRITRLRDKLEKCIRNCLKS